MRSKEAVKYSDFDKIRHHLGNKNSFILRAIVILTALYGYESWTLDAKSEKRWFFK